MFSRLLRLDGDESRGEEEVRLDDDEEVDPHDEGCAVGEADKEKGVLLALLHIVVF